MRPQIVTILTWALCLLTNATMLAQRSSAGSGPPAPTRQRGPELPLDSSIIVLIVLGVIIGSYFVLQQKRAKNTLG